MKTEPVFLIESPHAWGSVWQRPHHLVSRLAKSYPCHYVYTQYLKNIIKNPLISIGQRIKKTNLHNLNIYNLTLLNGERYNFILDFNRDKIKLCFNEIINKYSDNKIILWIYNPHNSFLANKLKYDILVYDIMDEYSGFPWSPPDIIEEEILLLKKADFVFAGTKALYESKLKYSENKIYCYLSGVEFEHFNRVVNPTQQINPEVEKIKKTAKIILGYTGMVDMRIDQESVCFAALKNPEFHFIFIGPIVGDFSEFRKHDNIHLFGQRQYEDLPEYIKGFDICMIPFVLNKLTMHINPTKILEYFASERFVISSKIPDVLNFYSDYVGFYDSPETFEQQIHFYIKNKNMLNEKIKSAAKLSEENSWDSRLKGMLSHINL